MRCIRPICSIACSSCSVFSIIRPVSRYPSATPSDHERFREWVHTHLPANPTSLQYVHWISCHPDINLLESGPQFLLVAHKELARLSVLGDIDEHSEHLVTILPPPVVPGASNNLRFPRDGVEFLFQLQKGSANQAVGHRLPVIKLQREQDFVATRFAHTWRDP